MAPWPDPVAHREDRDATPRAVFIAFLVLGCTAFGGPTAHLGYFREAFVVRRRWLSEAVYADLVALCQFLPGPASSQVGIGIGLARAGLPGALAAWLGFTLPSALALMGVAVWFAQHPEILASGAVHGLKLVAVSVVAHAVWGMARSLCPDSRRRLLALLTAGAAFLLPGAGSQPLLILVAGGIGALALPPPASPGGDHLPVPLSRRTGAALLASAAFLLVALPMATAAWPETPVIARFDAFFRTGALVFGGGHVVLPLLEAEVVAPGWIGADVFLAGYGAAQAVPGPLFTLAAYLGAAMTSPPDGLAGGLLATLAIFLPAFLLVAGCLPFWATLRRHAKSRAALAGINAGVVGLLAATLIDPVATNALLRPQDVALAAVGLAALASGRVPVWGVVFGLAVTGAVAG